MTLTAKESNFREMVKDQADKKFSHLIEEFCDYWTEPNRSKTKIRYEGERYFHVNRRLATWAKNTKEDFEKAKELKVRAKVVNTGKVKQIEDENIITAYNYYAVMGSLPTKYAEVFDILMQRKILPSRDEISEKTGKKCALYYDGKAALAAKKYPTLNRESLAKKAKCLVLEDYFKKFENEDQLKQSM